MKTGAGIESFGYYVPPSRIRASEISKVWKGEGAPSFMGVLQKSVAQIDEDSTTLGFEAARAALASGKVDPLRIGAIYFGSESKAYSVKPTSGILAGFLGIPPFHFSADLEFACKAGTSALQAALALVSSEMASKALVIGADCAQSRPGDALEYTAGCGGAALVVSRENTIATLDSTLSFSTDTPDFWREKDAKYPSHFGRFTGEPSYFRHTLAAAREILRRTETSPEDFSHVVFHQPNGIFPKRAAKALGFSDNQLEAGLFAHSIGNLYSAGPLLGLSRALECARKGERILVVSYGSGAGSDAFILTARQDGAGRREFPEGVFLEYGSYLRERGKI